MRKRIIGKYKAVRDWLCDFGSDKWVHFVAGLLIAYFASVLLSCVAGYDMKLVYALGGWSAAFLSGLLKEVLDMLNDEVFDVRDWQFTVVGGLIGAVLYLI